MNIALWIVQAVLALAFIAAGWMKVFAYEKYKAMSEKNGPMSSVFPNSQVQSGLFFRWQQMWPRGSASSPLLDSRRSCWWRLSTTCAGTSLQLFPPSSSYWPCLWSSGVFLMGREEVGYPREVQAIGAVERT